MTMPVPPAMLASQDPPIRSWPGHSRARTSHPHTRLQEGHYESTVPVIADRALQALTVAALEPEWEARFESRSYGFRPGRSCQDAMQAVFVTTRGKTCKRVWALDADLAAAFDRIGHSCLLSLLGTFPARGRVEQWLKAGVLDRGRFAPTEQGCPQGGVISPVLMNVVLHGMEEAAGVRYHPGGHRDAGTAVPGSPVLIRYADLCRPRHKSAYAEGRVMPTLVPGALVRAVRGLLLSA
jgi:RNA-directed DNA polymerase